MTRRWWRGRGRDGVRGVVAAVSARRPGTTGRGSAPWRGPDRARCRWRRPTRRGAGAPPMGPRWSAVLRARPRRAPLAFDDTVALAGGGEEFETAGVPVDAGRAGAPWGIVARVVWNDTRRASTEFVGAGSASTSIPEKRHHKNLTVVATTSSAPAVGPPRPRHRHLAPRLPTPCAERARRPPMCLPMPRSWISDVVAERCRTAIPAARSVSRGGWADRGTGRRVAPGRVTRGRCAQRG